MSLVGYPDFQEQAQWQSPLAVSFLGTIANGATQSFPAASPYFNVSNWQGVQLRVDQNVASLDVDMLWYDTATGSHLLGERRWTTVPNDSGYVIVPNNGPFLRIQISNLSGADQLTAAYAAFTNRIGPPFVTGNSGPVLSRAFGLIGAGGNAIIAASYLYAGPATWSIAQDSAEGWTAVLQCSTSNGTVTEFDWMGDQLRQSGDLSQYVTLPPRPIRLVIFNYGAAAHNFGAAVTPDQFR